MSAIKTSIVCLIYKSTMYLQFVYDQVKKYTDLTDKEFYFVANDANDEVLAYLNTHNIPHYVFTNTEENIIKHNTTEYYVNNVYRAWNYAANQAKGEYILFINSDMAFSPNWYVNLEKHITDSTCVTSRLVESGRYPSGLYGITYNCGQFLKDYDESKFLTYVDQIKQDHLHNSGLFMPLLIKKEYFTRVGGYPEGNALKGSNIFNPVIAKKGQPCTPGDHILMAKLKTINVHHKTSFDSITYHFQNGEMYE